MSLFAQFELLIFLLYAVECLAWTPGEAVLVVRTFVVRMGLARPWQVMATRRGRVVAAGWSPWDVGMVCGPWPICVDAHGVVNRPAHAMFDGRPIETLPQQWVAFESLEKITVNERELRVNGQRFAWAVSHEQAHEVAQLLRRLRDAPPSDRPGIVERALRRHFSARRIAWRWKRFQREAWVARSVGMALALLIFGVLPGLYYTVGLGRYWSLLIPAYGGLMVMGALEADRLYRRFYPKRVGERWKQVVLTLVSPTHAMRLANHVAHELMSRHHPAAVAHGVGNPRLAEEAAREAWLGLHHPRQPAEAQGREVLEWPEAAQAVETMRRQVARRLAGAALLRGRGAEDWDAPPTRTNPECVAYCPRCQSQYLDAGASCKACGGLALTVFEPALGPGDASTSEKMD